MFALAINNVLSPPRFADARPTLAVSGESIRWQWNDRIRETRYDSELKYRMISLGVSADVDRIPQRAQVFERSDTMAAWFSKDTCCLWYPVDLYKTSKKPLGVLHHKALRGSYRVTATECVLNFRPAHLPGPITHKISPGNNSPDTGFELVQKKNGGWKFTANREMVIFAGS